MRDLRETAADGIKVEIYDLQGKAMKTYYIGGITNDEHGTIMIMEGSEQPYVMHVPSFIGSLRVRYLVKEDEWRDRAVFNEKPEEVQEIKVEYPQQKSESFILEKTGVAEYKVRPFFSRTASTAPPTMNSTPSIGASVISSPRNPTPDPCLQNVSRKTKSNSSPAAIFASVQTKSAGPRKPRWKRRSVLRSRPRVSMLCVRILFGLRKSTASLIRKSWV